MDIILFIVAIVAVMLNVPHVGVFAAIGGLYAFLSFFVGLLNQLRAKLRAKSE